jgi:hypothetical protein
LFLFGDRRGSCSPSETGHNYLLPTTVLALVFTVWSLIAGGFGILVSRVIRQKYGDSTLGPWVTLMTAGAGFASAPFWVDTWNGTFLFGYRWAGVSCFFIEGAGMIFPFMMAPILTAACLFQEWLIYKLTKRSKSI